MRRTLVIVLATAIVGGLAGASIGLAFNKGDSTTSAEPTTTSARPVRGLDAEQIYRSDSPGVVVITDDQTQIVPASFFSPAQKEQVAALGSGFVIDKRGDIVTNDHVVQGAKDIRVGFSGGASYPAKVVGADPSTDIAVVHVKAPASALRPLGSPTPARRRSAMRSYAIGNPFGLDRTMTAGIVSATGRDIQAPNGLAIANAIQTDAPINHGNSGRPAARPRRPGDRHQRPDRGRHGRRQRRRRLRDPQRHRAVGRPAADRHRPGRARVARRRGRRRSTRASPRSCAGCPRHGVVVARWSRAAPQPRPVSKRRHAAGDRRTASDGASSAATRSSARRRQAHLLHRAARRRRRAAQAGRPARARGRPRRQEPNGRRSPSATLPSSRGGVR